MNIIRTLAESKLNIALIGSLDTNTAPQLEEVLNDSLDNITELILDFKETDYLSSAGLRVILAAQKKMAKQGSLVLINVPETIMDVFEITGFTDILTFQ
jgi:anti-sigma B factor antagonist